MLVAALDDDRDRCLEMRRSLVQAVPEATLEFFDSAPDMIAWLARHLDSVALVSLDPWPEPLQGRHAVRPRYRP
jgi:hypothetical protein